MILLNRMPISRNESRNMVFGKESSKSRASTEQGGKWAMVLLAATLIGNSTQGAQNVSLGWDSSGSTVAGYYLYSGPAAGVYTNRINIGNTTTASISGLKEGQTYHFAVSAYNSAGTESALSSDISYITPGVLALQEPANSNAMNIKFPVAPNHWYEIQASTDMRTWTTIDQTGVASSNAWVQFTDPQAGQFHSRFYRLVLH